ncbi:MAG: hypothetical protein ACI9TO_000515 [Rickettsiales bacterium]|jgi:hypothetical protein
MKKILLNSIVIGLVSLSLANCSSNEHEHKFIERTCKDSKENPHKCCKKACDKSKSGVSDIICKKIK